MEQVAITLLAGFQLGEGLLARGNINDAGEPLGLVIRRVPHREMRLEDRTITPAHPRLSREVLIALNGGQNRLDIVLKAFIRPERHNAREELLLAALPEQRDGVVIDVHDTGGLHELTDKSRVLSEVAPEIDDTGIANSAQHLSAARVVDLPKRHRHGLEEILIALLAVSQRLLGLLARSDIHDRARKLQVLRLVNQGMGDDMKMLDRSVRHLQPMLEIERFLVRCGSVNHPLHQGKVVRVHSIEHHFDGDIRSWARTRRSGRSLPTRRFLRWTRSSRSCRCG